jgi:hypothetical protein
MKNKWSWLDKEIPPFQTIIDEVKSKTDLCDTFSCYEDCDKCVEKYLLLLFNRYIKEVSEK